MDVDISQAFDKLNTKVDCLSLQVARLEQHKEDGQTKKQDSFDWWKIIISIVVLGMLVTQTVVLLK